MNQKQKEYAHGRVREIARAKELLLNARFFIPDKPKTPEVETLTVEQVVERINAGKLKLTVPVSAVDSYDRYSRRSRPDADSALSRFLPEGFDTTPQGMKTKQLTFPFAASLLTEAHDRAVEKWNAETDAIETAKGVAQDALRAEVTRILDELHLGDAQAAIDAIRAFEGKGF